MHDSFIVSVRVLDSYGILLLDIGWHSTILCLKIKNLSVSCSLTFLKMDFKKITFFKLIILITIGSNRQQPMHSNIYKL